MPQTYRKTRGISETPPESSEKKPERRVRKTVSNPETESPKNAEKQTSSLKLVALVLLMGAFSASGFFYFKYQEAVRGGSFSDEKLVSEVGKLMHLPQDETPTVATVTDVSKLSEQEFFRNAKNGNKVLVYASAKKAILYDPKEKRIIDVSPINVNDSPKESVPAVLDSVSDATASSVTEKTGQVAEPEVKAENPKLEDSKPELVRVALYNGTDKPGQTYKMDALLHDAISNMEAVIHEDAKDKTYEKTLIVNVSEKYDELFLSVAKKMNMEIADMPDGETVPDADWVIIIGNDKS